MDPPRCWLNQDRRGSEWYAWVVLVQLASGCFGEADDPAILSITPSIVSPESDTPAQIEGRNLQSRVKIVLDDDSPPEIDSHWAVRVGGTEAREVTLIDRSTLSALIPAGLPPGVYDVSVTVPGGSMFRLPEALTVKQLEPGSSPDASAGGASGQGGVAAGGSAGAAVENPSVNAGGPCTEFSPPERLSGFGLTGNLYGPALSLDALQLVFAQFSTAESLVTARRSDRGTVFAPATSVTGINGAGNNGTPFLTQDGLTLYFYSDRAGGLGSRDIWQARRSDPSAAWQNVAPVPVINSSSLDHLPTLSADQLTLVFASNRSGLGRADLWIAERTSVLGNFSPPQNLVALNTPVEDSGPSLSSDGLALYFSSQRPSEVASDIWVATRPDRGSSFGMPVKVDAVNSPGDDLNVTLSPDGLELILSSNRSGSYQLWRSLRSCP
jgi:hypothetical protein